MEVVWLEFFHKPKELIFLIFNCSIFFECVRDRMNTIDKTLVYSKLESPTVLSSRNYNAYRNPQIIYWKHPTFKFWQKLSKIFIFKFFEFLIYQTLIKAFRTVPYKKMGVFSVFWKKKFIRKKRKKPIFVYPGLRCTHKKIKFCM